MNRAMLVVGNRGVTDLPDCCSVMSERIALAVRTVQ
jgi:hypothetical protein